MKPIWIFILKLETCIIISKADKNMNVDEYFLNKIKVDYDHRDYKTSFDPDQMCLSLKTRF